VTFKFLQRIFVINQTSNSKIDGITAMKVVISIFECLPGQIDAALPEFLGMLLAELQVLLNKKKPIKNY